MRARGILTCGIRPEVLVTLDASIIMKIQYSHRIVLVGLVWMLFCTSISAAELLRIMPLGDSITAGLISPAPGYIPGGYRTKLWQNLTAAGYSVDFVGASQQNPDAGNLPDPDHNGYGGWTINQIDANIVNWLNATKPAAVLLHIGTNDTFGTDAEFKSVGTRLDKLITDITKQSPQTHLIVAQIISSSDATREARIQTYNGLVPDIVAAHANNGELVTMVDMHAAVPSVDFADSYHPNKVGYDLMGDAWSKAILALGPISNPTETPEPGAAVLSFLGLLGMGTYAWWQRN